MTDVKVGQSVNERHSSRGEAAIVNPQQVRKRKKTAVLRDNRGNYDLVKNHGRLSVIDVTVRREFFIFVHLIAGTQLGECLLVDSHTNVIKS